MDESMVTLENVFLLRSNKEVSWQKLDVFQTYLEKVIVKLCYIGTSHISCSPVPVVE